MNEVLGIIGGILLATCSIPELVSSFKSKKVNIGWPMIVQWYLGLIFYLMFALKGSIIGLISPVLNFIVVSIFIYLKIKERYVNYK